MSFTTPHNLISYRKLCLVKRAELHRLNYGKSSGSSEGLDVHLNNCYHQSKNFHCKKPPEIESDPYKDFDSQIKTAENIARQKYLKVLQAIPPPNMPAWFKHLMEHHILPTLNRIGFDESLGKALFEIAASSWQLMGPVNEKTVQFHPKINREIEEIRQGILLNPRNRYEALPWDEGPQSQQTLVAVRNNMAPKNLFDLLDAVATPWIILPRTFAFLKKRHCRYLPVYLKTINLETNEECLKIFVRITVEFLGNFSFKFSDHRYSPDQVAKLLFYGYSAMFWKNLRCPPQGMENSAVFENFLNWIKIRRQYSDFDGCDVKKTIGEMEKKIALVFPVKTRIKQRCSRNYNGTQFLVSLRHGCMGIKSVLKYFGIGPLLKSRLGSGRFPNAPLSNALHCLLYAIKTNYSLESIRTQQNIRKFTSHLRSAYDVMQFRFNRAENEILKRQFQVTHKIFN